MSQRSLTIGLLFQVALVLESQHGTCSSLLMSQTDGADQSDKCFGQLHKLMACGVYTVHSICCCDEAVS